MRRHPFDVRMGISAEGYLPWWLLRNDAASDRENSGYAGCQPSCLRRALSTIPDPARFVFVDVGCGKGRSMAVASELPFRKVLGIEIAPAMVRAARRNMDALRRRFPDRPPTEVVHGDATHEALPPGNVVVFLYQPFERRLMSDFVQRVARRTATGELFVVYENPLAADLFDTTPGFQRWFAETVACDPDERGCAPVDSEDIVVWQWHG